jgi:hypothetical protein
VIRLAGLGPQAVGPSETMIFGMPSRSTGAVYQKDEPLVSEAFSASVSSLSRLSMSSTPITAPS